VDREAAAGGLGAAAGDVEAQAGGATVAAAALAGSQRDPRAFVRDDDQYAGTVADGLMLQDDPRGCSVGGVRDDVLDQGVQRGGPRTAVPRTLPACASPRRHRNAAPGPPVPGDEPR
jgi:hypothetical protein